MAPMAVRVWRKDLQPHFRMIDECIAARVERAAALLAVWLEDGLIVRLKNS